MRHRELQEILNAATRRFSRKGSALLWRDGMYGRSPRAHACARFLTNIDKGQKLKPKNDFFGTVPYGKFYPHLRKF